MERTNRPLTKRPRAPIACNACRAAKSKCDGGVPACRRCGTLEVACVYTQGDRDKRMDRQAERKANSDLRNRVRELETQLAAASDHSQQPNPRSSVLRDSATTPSTSSRNDRDSPHEQQNTDSPVDVLAAGVFDHPSAGCLCYFGASSNHALFWSLTESIANLGHRSSNLYQEPLRPSRANGGPTRLPQPPTSSIANDRDKDPDEGMIPGRETAIRWVERFFDTVGGILPYISEPVLLGSIDNIDNNQLPPPAMQALLSIVFAHALSTLDDGSPEPFYRRTLRLLDPKTLYVSSLELLQTLLLLSIYQQNSQRSTESWTSHSLAVKTSYQLGIHAPSSYEHVGVYEKDLRSRLWFAVVNQDRMLASGLGQPCLIPPHYIRMGLTDMIVKMHQKRTAEMSYSRENLAYFRNLISLHEIMGTALDSIYDSNISPYSSLPLQDLVSRTLNLSLQMAQWRATAAPNITTSSVDFSTWSPGAFDSERNSILTSIFYYRTIVLTHGSLLMTVLGLATSGSPEIVSRVLQGTVLTLLKDDFSAVTELHQLIRGILRRHRSFLKSNAIWWTCNYAALTLSLHFFAFWVASNSAEASFIALGIGSSELEAHLRECLDTLKAIGVASAMSVKAHRCLHRHLHSLTSNPSFRERGRASRPFGPDVSPDLRRNQPFSSRLEQDGTNFMNTATALSTELFGDLSVQDFVNGDLLGLELGVSDFDATGLI